MRGALTWDFGSEDGVRRALQRAEGAGAEVVVPAGEQPWGVFVAAITDPDGHLWLLQDRSL